MRVFVVTMDCSMGWLSYLFSNFTGFCKTAGVEQNGHPQGGGGSGGAGHVHPVDVSIGSGFPCPAQAAMACRLTKAGFDRADLGVTRHGVGSGVDKPVSLLWRASEPRLGSGLAGMHSGCLRCFGHFYSHRSCCLIAAITRQWLLSWPYEGAYNTAMSGYFGAHLRPSSLPLTLPNSISRLSFFLGDSVAGCPYCLASLPLHPCQPVFKAPAKRSESEGTLETELLLATYSLLPNGPSSADSAS